MTHHVLHKVDSYVADLSFQGIPYAEFDRTGHWSIWSIVKMFEAARATAIANGFLDIRATRKELKSTMVVIKQVIRVNPTVHREVNLYTPIDLRFVMKFMHMGNSSLIYSGQLRNGHSGEVLGEIWLKYVQIDSSTRRPVLHPENVRSKFSPFMSKDISPEMGTSDIPEKPSDAYKYSVDTRHSDTDMNKHINQAAYVRYCMDCATDAAINGFYGSFRSDMCLYPTTEWKMHYTGESFANENLDVYTWQNKANFERISFSILRENKQIFHAETIFEYSQSGHSKM